LGALNCVSSKTARISTPIILVNFKTYLEATGEKSFELAKIAEEVARETGICIIVAPQTTDIRRIVGGVDIPVFAQHMDPVGAGAYTGHVTAEAIKEAGASGTLLNHSERRLRLSEIDSAIERAKATGLTSVVCANTAQVSAASSALKPNMVAIEPPELIGTGIAVSKAKPEIITNTVSFIRQIDREIIILCGAGITKGEDVSSALKLGTQGVLVASGVVKAKDRRSALLDLVRAALEKA